MKPGEFVVELDGRRVLVDQASQKVVVLDKQGAPVFEDRIQVAAGSVQGIFSAVEALPGILPDTSRNVRA